jgi:hypothetical protein
VAGSPYLESQIISITALILWERLTALPRKLHRVPKPHAGVLLFRSILPLKPEMSSLESLTVVVCNPDGEWEFASDRSQADVVDCVGGSHPNKNLAASAPPTPPVASPSAVDLQPIRDHFVTGDGEFVEGFHRPALTKGSKYDPYPAFSISATGTNRSEAELMQ